MLSLFLGVLMVAFGIIAVIVGGGFLLAGIYELVFGPGEDPYDYPEHL